MSTISKATESPSPTWRGEIAPIIHQNCTRCHRDGEAAPFPLLTYQETAKKAKTIARVTEERYMPPWHPDAGHGEFVGEMRLSDQELALLQAWAKSGATEGVHLPEPSPPDFPQGWQLGQPDLIVEMPEAFEVYSEGKDIYRYFLLPLNLEEDQWVQAIAIRPSARNVVHHVLFFLDDSGKARKLDAQESKAPGFRRRAFRPSGSLGGWAVGASPMRLQEYAHHLPTGSDLVLQTHFHPSGKVEHEKTKIGLYFAKKPPERQLHQFQVPPRFGGLAGINIAPGETQYLLKDHFMVSQDIELITVWPHAHQLATSFHAQATLPNGSKLPLLKISEWDFNWQGQYQYRAPLSLPKGTRIDIQVTYDNSEDNPHNPHHPPRRTFFGEGTTDEMGSIVFQCVAKEKSQQQNLKKDIDLQQRNSGKRFADQRSKATRLKTVLKLDKNFDDHVTLAETPRIFHKRFHKLDRDSNEIVTASEVLSSQE